MQVMDYYTPLRGAKQSFLYMVIFPVIIEVFILAFFYIISVNSFDFTLTIPFIILAVIFWLIWRITCKLPLFKPALVTYELPFESGGKPKGRYSEFPVHVSCTEDMLHYRQSKGILGKIYEREVNYQDIEYVTLHSLGSGVLILNLQCNNSLSIDIAFSLFPAKAAVIILDIILRKAPHITCNEMVNQFRQGKYWPTDTCFLA